MIIRISHNMLSNYCCNNANGYRIKIGLPLYLSLGIKLVSVHRILKLRQVDWLKKYSDFNTDKRKNVANTFLKKTFLK